MFAFIAKHRGIWSRRHGRIAIRRVTKIIGD